MHLSLTDRRHLASRKTREPPANPTPAQIEPALSSNSDTSANRFSVAGEILKNRKVFLELFCITLFIQILSLFLPLLYLIVIDKVLVHHGLSTLDTLIIGFVVLIFFESILSILRSSILGSVLIDIDLRLARRTLWHVLHLPLSFFQNRKSGEITARIDELRQLRALLTNNLIFTWLDLIFIFIYLGLMFNFSMVLFSIVVISLFAYAVAFISIGPLLRRRFRERFQAGEKSRTSLIEAVLGIETVKSSTAERYLYSAANQSIEDYALASHRTETLSDLSNTYNVFVGRLTTAALIWFGANLVLESQLTLGQLVAFNMLNIRLVEPIRRVTQIWSNLQRLRALQPRIGEILNVKTETDDAESRLGLPRGVGNLVVDDVSFSFAPGSRPPVLRSVSLSVQPGERVALIGASGSGKSTLIRIIQGLHQPTSGAVLLDGLRTSLAKVHDIRRTIGVVPQEVVLFDMSIRDNIALGRDDLATQDVIAAAKLAGVDAFVGDLEDGYETVVGERGLALSGGQRQRVALARALVTRPTLLLFDEPTTGLDSESLDHIWGNWDQICAGRTVIIVSHDPSMLNLVDRVIRIDRGEVVADGPLETAATSAEPHRLSDLRTGRSAP